MKYNSGLVAANKKKQSNQQQDWEKKHITAECMSYVVLTSAFCSFSVHLWKIFFQSHLQLLQQPHSAPIVRGLMKTEKICSGLSALLLSVRNLLLLYVGWFLGGPVPQCRLHVKALHGLLRDRESGHPAQTTKMLQMQAPPVWAKIKRMCEED